MVDRVITAIRGNLIAWLALFVALGGTSLAASHYIITSTKQIKPSVLKQLKVRGRTGAAGTPGGSGPQGAAGSTGATGVEGPRGVEGARGADGLSATSALPAGQTESGEYGLNQSNVKNTQTMDQPVTFAIPLRAPLSAGQVVYNKAETTSAHCSGPGHADRGFACIYSSVAGGILTEPAIHNIETSPPTEGTGRFGFDMEWFINTTTGENAFDLGTYTVTAG